MSSGKNVSRAIVMAAALVVSAIAGKAGAADLGPFSTPDNTEQPVDFGTGWYIRGDLAYANDSVPPLSDDLTQFLGNARTSSLSAGLGFGYKVNNWIRTDLTLDYWNPVKAFGNGPSKQCITQLTTINNIPTPTAYDDCTPFYNSSVRTWDLLANGYVDLGTWYGFTPYVGGGLGVSLTRLESSVNWYMSNGVPYHVSTDGFYFNMDQSSSDMRYQFAWALMAGVAYTITPQALLDVGYRYVNLGKLWGIADPAGNITSKTLDAHEVRVGIRYLID